MLAPRVRERRGIMRRWSEAPMTGGDKLRYRLTGRGRGCASDFFVSLFRTTSFWEKIFGQMSENDKSCSFNVEDLIGCRKTANSVRAGISIFPHARCMSLYYEGSKQSRRLLPPSSSQWPLVAKKSLLIHNREHTKYLSRPSSPFLCVNSPLSPCSSYKIRLVSSL